MPTVEDVQTAVEALQQQCNDLQNAHDTLERAYKATEQKFNALALKLQYPGSRLLVDLQYRLVEGFPRTITVDSSEHLIPGIAGDHGPFDIRFDDQHAFYLLGAKPQEDTAFVLYHGTSIAIGSCSVAYAVLRNGTTLETWLDLYNATVDPVSIDVILYRHLGIK